MAQVKKVNAAWDRIEKWFGEKNKEFKLPAGATAAEITSVETHIGYSLPKDLKASLMRHNGTEAWTKCELLSTKRLISEWDCWAGLVDDGTFDGQTGEKATATIQKCWYDKKWIPIDADGGGNGNMLDLNPGPKGKVGQIIYMDHEIGPSGPVFADLAAYLEKAADELEAGRFEPDEEGMLEDLEEGEDEDGDDEGEELEEDEGDEEDEIEDEDSEEEYEEAPKKSKKAKRN